MQDFSKTSKNVEGFTTATTIKALAIPKLVGKGEFGSLANKASQANNWQIVEKSEVLGAQWSQGSLIYEIH